MRKMRGGGGGEGLAAQEPQLNPQFGDGSNSDVLPHPIFRFFCKPKLIFPMSRNHAPLDREPETALTYTLLVAKRTPVHRNPSRRGPIAWLAVRPELGSKDPAVSRPIRYP